MSTLRALVEPVYVAASTVEVPDEAFSSLRAPFGWRAVAIQPEATQPISLHWSQRELPRGPSRLRFTLASDNHQEAKVEVLLSGSNRILGVFDIRYGSALQPFEIVLHPADVPLIVQRGVTLHLSQGTSPLRILSTPDGATEPKMPSELAPHLMVTVRSHPPDEFLKRFCSLASLQPWGRSEGCVLEGLHSLSHRDASAREALQQHLDLFFPENEPLRADLQRDFSTLLPYSVLARLRPNDAAVEAAWQYCLEPHTILSPNAKMITASDCYHLAYPLAVLARHHEHDFLLQTIMQKLHLHRDALRIGDDLYESDVAVHHQSQRNTARAVAWYFLGMTCTLIELEGVAPTADLKDECRRVAAWVLPMQRENGLWNGFLHEGDVRVDTAGSAGIAVALALGAKQGWFNSEAQSSAQRALMGLREYLTPDGFLAGAAQDDHGGGELQRSDYRVLSPPGMGLMAQLQAALEDF